MAYTYAAYYHHQFDHRQPQFDHPHMQPPPDPEFPYWPAQPHSFHSADQPWQQTYQLCMPLWEEPTLHNQPPCPDTQPWQQPPDPPDWQHNLQPQLYGMAQLNSGVGRTESWSAPPSTVAVCKQEMPRVSEGQILNPTAKTLESTPPSMNSNEEIILSSLCDRIMAVCNRLDKRLDKFDEHQPYKQPQSQPYSDPYTQARLPLTSKSPWQQDYTSFHEQPPGWQPPPTQRSLPAPMPEIEQYHCYPSPTPSLDDPYYHYQPSGEQYPPSYNGGEYSSNSYDDSVDDYSYQHPPYTFTDSYALLRNPYAGYHLGQPDYQPPRPPYTGPYSYRQQQHHQHQQPELDQQTAVVVPQPPQPRQPSCEPPTSPLHSATAPMPAAVAVQPPPVAVSPPCSLDISPALVLDVVEQSTPSAEEAVYGDLYVIVIGYVTEVAKYQCRCSFLGVYDDVLSDLFDPTHRKLAIKDYVKKGFYVNNLMEQEFDYKENLGLLSLDLHDPEAEVYEWRRSTVRLCAPQWSCAFDPGGDTSPNLMFVMLFVVSWFPP